MIWRNRKVLVTGGASFIGSSLVDALVARGAQVRVVDDLSSSGIESIQGHLDRGVVEFVQGDLRNDGVAANAVKGMSVVFHLAADHGGRGYVDLHQAACATNLLLDALVFRACLNEGVDKVVYASSGCVYPTFIQMDIKEVLYLTEDQVGPPYDADNMYGWAKLMAEMTLQAYHKEWGMKAASARYFTVYGPRGVENHAVMAMIARAFIKQDPYYVWGTGEQIRNWTYIDDIVEGTILCAERIDDGTAVNLGTRERIRVLDAVHEILRYMGHSARIVTQPDKPTGPYNRVADNSLGKKLLGWEPAVMFQDGLHRTIDWYVATHKPEEVKRILEKMLTERNPRSQAA
jgi:nucleoside-diphosphate-sugar epimerase